MSYLEYSDADEDRHEAAERFVAWLENRIVSEARGDNLDESAVDPTGRFWLGRLGPKDFVTLPDDRADRLEPCAIGVKLRPRTVGPWTFSVRPRFTIWVRSRAAPTSGLRWRWSKSSPIEAELAIEVPPQPGEYQFGEQELAAAIAETGAANLSAEIRVRVAGRSEVQRHVEITLVNTSQEAADFGDGRFFECSLQVEGFDRQDFELEALPDSFRFERRVGAYGINCGADVIDSVVRTSDSPSLSRARPRFWTVPEERPDFGFESLASDPLPAARSLLTALEGWATERWSEQALARRAERERWSEGMLSEATRAAREFGEEVTRIRRGCELLEQNAQLRRAFQLMNRAMAISARGKYDRWRPFQVGFLLANLQCLVDVQAEADVVDIVWFATGGGKTETYLGLLLTAAFSDRMRGKVSGVSAWSRFPLRMLSLQQTQRFANALAAAEIVRREEGIEGDPFSLGFLVGGGATPNRIKKESERELEDADKLEDMDNPCRLLDTCPFCRQRTVETRFDRRSWRLVHICNAADCPSSPDPLPLYVVDDEIWRFLPTVVIGTLDKAANISRHSGMRGLVGAPWGLCSRPGHGFTYARRSAFPNGCLVPDCRGGDPLNLPMDADLFAPSFRLQDELHLLRDSLGAVDAHYEAALDAVQEELSGRRPKILASSATLSGFQKQVDVLYGREARVFPQPPPRDGDGFWAGDSSELMRRYVALAPRRLTVEFVVDRLVVSLQLAIRSLIAEPDEVCRAIEISDQYASFLVSLYGTNVVYGNTLQDIDAVVRSSETQYAELDPPPNVATLTGRTDFDEVRATLDRLENEEPNYEDRLHLIAASSMMSHGVDIDRLNVMIMLAFPLGVAEFIQATARVGRRWPALVIVVPKMTRERDSSVYRAFPQFISHGDRFVEPIPITRKSRRVLERTLSGLELARIGLVHEPRSNDRLTTPRALNAHIRQNPSMLDDDFAAIAAALRISSDDELIHEQLSAWFERFKRNLSEPSADARFLSDLSPTGDPMTSLRDVEEQAPVKGDSTR